MLQNAIYTVISPEGCAAILWRDNNKAKLAADSLGITANFLKEKGIIDDVINNIKKEKSADDCLTIGILTHSQIMGNNDWHIFGKLVKAIKKMGIEFIGIEKILHG